MGIVEISQTNDTGGEEKVARFILVENKIFSRISGVLIAPEDFAGSEFIAHMGTSHHKPERKYTVPSDRGENIYDMERFPTSSADVINQVLRKTHHDLGKTALGKLHEEVDRRYEHYFKYRELLKKEEEQVFDGLEKTDLIRGVEAFTEATQDMVGQIYDDTILKPAREFATWLIVREITEN